jgi:predicted nuclease of restriction endonuclease-like RecB superfamily
MLTGRQVRVRFARDRVIPLYIDAGDPDLLEIADLLLRIFRSRQGSSRADLDEEVNEAFGAHPAQLLVQGLTKLLEDRCDFDVVSGRPPEEVREAVFSRAAARRKTSPLTTPQSLLTNFDRTAVLQEAATALELTPEQVERSLFADLKSEQRLLSFKDTTAGRLLERYNVALAQAMLLRSTRVHVLVRGEPAPRYRQLFRLIKFHRLICEIEPAGRGTYQLHLDGPLSLFSSTQKYGLQLALFLPGLLRVRDFELRAELIWGAQRKEKIFTLTPSDRLVSHAPDHGMYVPPELTMFAELFRKKVQDWELVEETGVYPLGDSFWIPDYRLVERATGRQVILEVLGFWRRSSLEKHLDRLRKYADQPFVLAVSEQIKIDDAELDGLPAQVHRFRQMPLPDEIVRLANLVGRHETEGSGFSA